MSRKYDRTDLEVFASDVQKLAVKIEASINGGRKKPHNPKVTKQIEDRLDETTSVLWKIWHDLEGDQ